MTRDPWHGLAGGRVLDVATGKGAFVRTLLGDLASYQEIVAVDIDQAAQFAFNEAFRSRGDVSFELANANALPFASESFDTVSICGSLHHMSEPRRALSEMYRVLKTGGTFLIVEQRRDGQRGPRFTHRLFHEWPEEVLGIARHTYTRPELLEFVRALDLSDVRLADQLDTSDPFEPARLARFDKYIDEYIDKAGGRPDMVERGGRIRVRLRSGGIRISSGLAVAGSK